MNQEQAKAWLPLIQAAAEGKTLQIKGFEWVKGQLAVVWVDFYEEIDFKISPSRLRIKLEPKKQWYRVALLKNRDGTFFTLNADSTDPYKDIEKALIGEYENNFVEWLTDRIEYELPEGEV